MLMFLSRTTTQEGNVFSPSRFCILGLLFLPALAVATPFTFSTGNTDGQYATASRIPQTGVLGIESADDFILTSQTLLTSATFTGLMTTGPGTIQDVNIDLYRVFPADSDGARTPNVVTRVNSPADTEFDGRSALGAGLTFTTDVLDSTFTASNSILSGISPAPNQTTGGEGSVRGREVRFNVTFTTPFDLAPGHYFFVPTVQLASGDFYWLSAPKPIIAPGTPFMTDLQSWIRNENLDPDWSRIGTDVIGGPPANATFSLEGTAIPEPSTFGLLVAGAASLLVLRTKKHS
jgi:hypothetical protein